MTGTFSFRAKLMAAFVVVALLALLPPAWYARHIFTSETRENAKTEALRVAELAKMLMVREGSFEDVEELRAWVNDLGGRLGMRVTYINANGRVLADSRVPEQELRLLDNHADRPEILALADREYAATIRYSSTLEKDLVYAATIGPDMEGAPPGYLRMSYSFSDIAERLDQQIWHLLLVLAAALVLAALLSYGLIRTLGRPVNEMVNVARSIGRGEYERRLRSLPGREFSKLAEAINTMAANIDSQIETITWQNEQLEAVLNGMREGVMVLDRSGRIKSVNRNMERIFPGALGAEGKRPLELSMSPELQRACEQALAGKTRKNIALQIETTPGRVYDVNVVSPRSGRHGLGVIAVFHDITEIKRLERVRQDFVANVSHELRTPLTTVKGYAETLLSAPPNDRKTLDQFHEVILKNADHMTKLIEDLLSLSRLERGQERFEKMNVNAANAVTEAYRACSNLAENKNIELIRDLPEGKVMVSADYDRLVQVFRNLLENAFKYGPADSKVFLSSSETDGEIAFRVADRGPGIPKSDQERIFERFYRVEKHRARVGSSSGLGLAICKHIVERLGGEIRVESPAANGEGASFTFTVPKASQDQPANELREPTEND
jgi:two-component system phosphate regulon sensor histidine kinase PhoR